MRSAVVLSGVTETLTGLRQYLPTSSWICFGMVAEKNSVWRSSGTSWLIRRSA